MKSVRELQKKYLPAVAPEDFFILLSHGSGKEKVFLLAHPEHELSANETEKVETYLKRRLKSEPVAYIVEKREFYGRDFHVTSDTLIPRPETEHMIESILERVNGRQEEETDIIDIGTGSGNIIITLAKEIQKIHPVSCIKYHALDISGAALRVAEQNATYHHVNSTLSFLESDLLQNFSLTQKKKSHAIIAANLPYLSKMIYEASEKDVRDYEPKSALISGTDGLDHYRRLLHELANFSLHHISTTLFLEISPEQTGPLRELILTSFPHSTICIIRDLSGRERLMKASF
jgi:release factor glutamine methyltransferase